MKVFLSAISLLTAFLAFPQSRTDSLEQALAESARDTSRIRIMHLLFKEYQKEDPGRAIDTIEAAIALAEQMAYTRGIVDGKNHFAEFLRIQSREDTALLLAEESLELAFAENYQRGASDALNAMASLYWQKGNFEKAREVSHKAIALSEEMDDQRGAARAYILLGAIDSQNGAYTAAMEHYTRASEIFLEQGNLDYYALSLGNIGYIQRSLENYESAESYFRRADSLYQKLDNPSGLAFAAYNLSVVYKNLGRLEEALDYNRKGLEIYERLGYRKRVAYCYYTQGEIYRQQASYQIAKDRYQQALNISRQVDDSVNMGYSLVGVAEMSMELGDRPLARTSLHEAAGIAEGLKLDILLMDIHKDLAELLQASGNYPAALDHLGRYAVLKDSLYTREKRELATEIEAKYQNAQKEKEIALLASQRDLQAMQLQRRIDERNAIIALAIIALILAALVYNQYRIKQKTNRELKELDRIKSDFFANITHEFRTPLTLIKAPIDQLEQNPQQGLPPETVKMIRRNTNRVLQLVNQLLDLSRIDKGSLHLDLTEGDVYTCLRTATASFNSHAAQRGIDYRVQIPAGRLWASFDRDKLEKILYNLLSNAFKFSEDGSLIRIKVSYEGENLQIRVKDSGRGIPEDQLPFIFDRFYQVDSSARKDQEGSGIGLSLSRDLVELMDGTITVTSELNKGSSFTIQLPLQEIKTGDGGKETADDLAISQHIHSGITAPEFPDRRDLPVILLVEDNPDMRQFITSQLHPYYRVREAQDGEAGWRMASAFPPDLVITDLMMPKMDGLELSRKLKSELLTSHIPIIVLTAKIGTDNRIEGLETGADDYLDKPFDARELLARVRNLIEQRQRLRSLFAASKQPLNPREVTMNSLDEQFLERLLQLLEDRHADPDFGVNELQASLALSRTQLHRKIKALTDESPGQLLRNFRLKRAAQLLAQKADTVTQVAYRVGFGNLSYFAKCFKEKFGVAPSRYSG